MTMMIIFTGEDDDRASEHLEQGRAGKQETDPRHRCGRQVKKCLCGAGDGEGREGVTQQYALLKTLFTINMTFLETGIRQTK